MKKIYAQKKLFIFLNSFSFFFCVIGLYGGFTIDKSMFYLLFISLGLSILSLLFLINKIYYNDEEIRFSFIYSKRTFKFNDIKEVFVQYDLVAGMKVIFNFEKETDRNCYDYLEYTRKLKKENIKNTIYFIGGSKKDIEELLAKCHCSKKGFDF